MSLADKLDTIVGLFAAGEKPTGSRDPYGLRRAAQGVIRILTDFARVQGVHASGGLKSLIDRAFEEYAGSLSSTGNDWKAAVDEFFRDRALHLLEKRGIRADEARAVADSWRTPHSMLRRADALAQARRSPEFERLAVLFKRAKNITKDVGGGRDWPAVKAALNHPAEVQLATELDRRWPVIDRAVADERFVEAMHEIAQLYAPVDKFFVDVLVMADDPAIRQARLSLVASLRDTILNIADIAEVAPDEARRV